MIEGEEALAVIEEWFEERSDRPSKVYAIRAKSKDLTGKPYTRVRLFVSRATTNAVLDVIDKSGAPWDSVEVFEGEIVWAKKATTTPLLTEIERTPDA